MTTTLRLPDGAGGTVTGVRHGDGDGDVLTIAHGAGGNLDMAPLPAYADALAERGVSVVRINLPYAEAGRRSPGGPKPAEECWAAVAAELAATAGRLFIGGKSYGGRMASHAAAKGTPCAGLVFLGYPLHAPGKEDRLRDAHLGDIAAPMLFLQGTRDPFAGIDLLRTVVGKLPSATLHEIAGGDHSLRVKGRPGAEVLAEIAGTTAAWIAASPG